MMSAIGPNGKDVYPVALVFDQGGNQIQVHTSLVEALSEDEAYGIAAKMGKAILRDVPSWGTVIHISVGDSDTFDEKRSRFKCSTERAEEE